MSHFTIFRIILGAFLTWHFAALLPYAAELYSNQGVIPNASSNPTGALSPTFFTPILSQIAVVSGVVASVCFLLGKFRVPAALWLVALSTLLFLRNNLTANPGLPYINLALLLSTLVPRAKDGDQQIPAVVLRTAHFLLALGYSFSGLTKLSSPSWLDGSAFSHILRNPLSRPDLLNDSLLALPDIFSSMATWGALLAEVLYLPFYAWRKSRPFIWVTLLSMHFGLMITMDFADLSLGMVMIHLFTFQPEWLPGRRPRLGSHFAIGFDGSCLFCNKFVNTLTAMDRNDTLRFYQLPAGAEADTMRVHDGDQAWQKSDAALLAIETMGGLFRVFACISRLVPHAVRDYFYDLVARNRHRFLGAKATCALPHLELSKKILATPPTATEVLENRARFSSVALLLTALFSFGVTSCSFVEQPPTACASSLTHHGPPLTPAFRKVTGQPRIGDVVAFHMPRGEAIGAVATGKIQKIPYSLFRYGHVALVVPRDNEPRLLQMALGVRANSWSTLDDIQDLEWTLYRPTQPLDHEALADFAKQAEDSRVRYDLAATLGLRNQRLREGDSTPPRRLTCVTLVESALQAAGLPLNVRHRGGYLDLITPAQLTRASLAEKSGGNTSAPVTRSP